MKKGYLKYFLIAIVVVIWGLIGFKIYSIFKVDPIESSISARKAVETNNNVALDSFAILANYPDPFLRSSHSAVNETADTALHNNNKKSKEATNTNINKVLWPNIIYTGKFNKSKTDLSTILVVINGKTQVLSLGDVVDNVELLSISTDSILVKYSDETKYIKK